MGAAGGRAPNGLSLARRRASIASPPLSDGVDLAAAAAAGRPAAVAALALGASVFFAFSKASLFEPRPVAPRFLFGPRFLEPSCEAGYFCA